VSQVSFAAAPVSQTDNACDLPDQVGQLESSLPKWPRKPGPPPPMLGLTFSATWSGILPVGGGWAATCRIATAWDADRGPLGRDLRPSFKAAPPLPSADVEEYCSCAARLPRGSSHSRTRNELGAVEISGT
jgi:hypothetical protein